MFNVPYLNNLYAARLSNAQTRRQGLIIWLEAHHSALQELKKRSELARDQLLLAMQEAVAISPALKNLLDYPPYREKAQALAKLEKERTVTLDKLLTSYCQEHNYRIYQCATCKDRGYLENTKETLAKPAHSSYNCPACFAKLVKPYLIAEDLWQIPANLKDAYDLLSIDTQIFQKANQPALAQDIINNYTEQLKKVFIFGETLIAKRRGITQAQSLAKHVLLLGAVGAGKSYLAVKLAEHLLEAGVATVFVKASALKEKMQRSAVLNQSFNPEVREIDSLNNYYKLLYQADLIVLDDLAATQLQAEQFLKFLDNLGAEQHLLLTTNLSLEQLQAAYGERVFSRLLHQAQVLTWQTADLRLI